MEDLLKTVKTFLDELDQVEEYEDFDTFERDANYSMELLSKLYHYITAQKE